MLIKINPLSVNKCWKGRRFKTTAYKAYEDVLLLLLQGDYKVPTGGLVLNIEVGYSNKRADLDNCLKPVIDILQNKYEFNDNRIYEIYAKKVIVEKGKEYLKIDISACHLQC